MDHIFESEAATSCFVEDIGPVGFDDSADDPCSARADTASTFVSDSDEGGGNDITEDEIVSVVFGERLESGPLENVALNVVAGEIFGGANYADLIGIDADDGFCAKETGSDAEDAASAPDIGDFFTLGTFAFEKFEAASGCGVVAGTKGLAGIKFDHEVVWFGFKFCP